MAVVSKMSAVRLVKKEAVAVPLPSPGAPPPESSWEGQRDWRTAWKSFSKPPLCRVREHPDSKRLAFLEPFALRPVVSHYWARETERPPMGWRMRVRIDLHWLALLPGPSALREFASLPHFRSGSRVRVLATQQSFQVGFPIALPVDSAPKAMPAKGSGRSPAIGSEAVEAEPI